jgi:hypothetical protein
MLVVFLAFLNLYNLVQALRTQLRIETNDILTFEVTRNINPRIPYILRALPRKLYKA